MLKSVIFALCFIISISNVYAQPSYFPSNAEHLRQPPAAPPNDLIALVDQRAMIPYKGRSCDDESLAFVETEDGNKKYGNNEWTDAHIQITHYKPAGKILFDQNIKLLHPSVELKKKEEGFKTATGTDGKPLNYTIKTIDVPDGKMVFVNELNTCVMTKYKEFTSSFFYSYAIVGTTIIWIDAAYNAAEPDLAIKIHSEIVEKLKKTGVN